MGKSSIKSPVTKGVAKVPVILQLEALECGAAALAMVAAYYGKWLTLEQARADCGVSRDGSNAANIAKAAMAYGFKVNKYKRNPQSIREKGVFPCIIHWNFDHFVVLNGFKGKYAYINDPAYGTVRVSEEEFDRSFTGITINLVPGDDFQTGGKKRNGLFTEFRRLGAGGTAMAMICTASVAAAIIAVAYPLITGFYIDDLTEAQNKGIMPYFVISLIVLAVIQLAAAWIQTACRLRLNGRLSVSGCSTYMWRLMQFPIGFFSQRPSSDVYIRMDMLEGIIASVVNLIVPLVMNTAAAILCIVLMIKSSLPLTAVSVSVLAVDIALSRLISRTHRNTVRALERDKERLSAETLSGLSMIETIKVSGAEDSYFEKWSGLQAAVGTRSTSVGRYGALLSSIPDLLSYVLYFMIMIMGAALVMQGKASLGTVWMFQGLLSLLLSPVLSLSGAGKKVQTIKTQYERVDDVLNYPPDKSLTDTSSDEALCKLRGDIELKNLTFGYSRLSEPVIKDFSLSIRAGSKVALVGASGCGKSTLSGLISGLYEPWEGEILFDGRHRNEIPRDVMTGSVAVVDQDIMLFDGTIRDNIRMWDRSIEDFDVILAARDAQIHEDIIAREGGYKARISADGRNLSGGQMQRMEIARVLAADPSIIILDEATSALDAQTEADAVKAIKERGITCLIIAHRLSTIRECDEIIVLDKGRITERGTHEELIVLGGKYTELVVSE